jgi:hypothetical protein
MAYKDILKTGTYSYIDEVSINKKIKSYSFKFFIYENDNKEKIILEKYYDFICKYKLCKVIDKIYTSEKEINKSLKEIYYNNSKDEINTPNLYNIELENYEELDEKNVIINKTRLKFINVTNYSYIYNSVDKEYYLTKDYIKNNGIETDHYFDNFIYPSINNNIIEVLYKTLETIEPSYKDYPKI